MNDPAPLSMRDRVSMLRLPESSASDGTRVPWLPWTLTLLLAFAATSMAIRTYRNPPATTEPTPIAGVAPSSGVRSTPNAPAAPGAVVLESKGYIIPAHQIQVSPIEVSGRIKEIYIEEGKRFNAGDKLAVLDDESYQADVAEAKANVKAAQVRLEELRNGSRPEEVDQAYAELKETDELLKQAKLEFERSKQMAGGSLSAKEFEAAQFAYYALVHRQKKLEKTYELVKIGPRRERVDQADADVRQSEARLRRAEWRLANCIIRAPVSGTILKKSAELGNLVSPLSFNVASSVCEMADLSDLEAELEVSERDIAKVARSMPCKITTDAYPDRFYSGFVDRLMPIALQNKAAVQVRVKVAVPKDEEGQFLKPGMNARVTFLQPDRPVKS